MPATTSSSVDPIGTMLQRTFGGIEAKREGLIRGGNSASARPFSSSVEKQIQSSAKHSLLMNGSRNQRNGESSIQFDSPTRCKSSLSMPTASNQSKIVVLNPASRSTSKQQHEKGKEAGIDQAAAAETLPKAKVVLYAMTEIELGYGRSQRSAGSGMANAGNTCYLNSTLQALFHIPALYNYLLYQCSSQHMSKCSTFTNGFLQNCTICALVHTLRDSLKSNVIRPHRIYEKLKSICKHMVQGRQEDAHEFLRYLIDSLQRSYLNTVPGGKQLDVVSKETSPFNQIFGGYMRQEVTCLRCKHVSTTFQHMMDILVDIRQASNIEQALQNYFRQEKLGQVGDEASLYKCEKCKIKVSAKRRCFMERPPAVLCIQLKRFSLFGGKIGKPVQLNRHLNVTNYVHPGVTKKLSATNGGIHYVLRSMITHVGPSPNCGHYTAIGEAAGGQFFQFDDSFVKPIALQQVLSTASYVVFYEMVPSSWKSLISGKAPAGAPSAQPKPVPAQPSPLPAAPRLINASGLVNKLGVVSTVAKGVVNSVADVAKSLNGSPKPKAKSYGVLGKVTGLVPYERGDSSSEEESSSSNAGKGSLTASTTGQARPGFVPRAVTIKNLPKPVSATNGKWTVTDIDHHNPSVHSDNSTGSTSNSWKITPQRPQSAMSSEESSTTGKWTVTPLRKAIEEDSSASELPNAFHAGRLHHQQNGTSTPSSSSSTSASSSSDKMSSRKRPSVDDSAGTDDYDAELDRGRTKKVKKQEMNSASSVNGATSNPFQSYQDRQNSHRHSNSGSRNNQHRSSNGNRDRGYPQQQRSHSGSYNQYHHHQRRSSYSSDRRKSFGGHDHKNHYQQHHYKSYHRSYEPDHYRDFNRRRSR